MLPLQSLASLLAITPEHGAMCFVADVDSLYVCDTEHTNGEGVGGHWFRVGMVENPVVATPSCCSNCGAPPAHGASCRYCGVAK